MSCHQRVKWQSSQKCEHTQWPVNSHLCLGNSGRACVEEIVRYKMWRAKRKPRVELQRGGLISRVITVWCTWNVEPFSTNHAGAELDIMTPFTPTSSSHLGQVIQAAKRDRDAQLMLSRDSKVKIDAISRTNCYSLFCDKHTKLTNTALKRFLFRQFAALCVGHWKFTKSISSCVLLAGWKVRNTWYFGQVIVHGWHAWLS